HTLEFLSELGLPGDHPSVATAVDRILESAGPDGVPRLPMTYPKQFGGPGVEMSSWALCDAPTLLTAAVRFGRSGDARVRRGIATLTALARENGWPCAVSPELKFRGPGRKEDPCPYATLVMLRLLAAYAEALAGASAHAAASSEEADAILSSDAARAGVGALLACWERSRDWHPYIFYAGDDFRKLKAPFLWYDVLHVAEILSCFPFARGDPRLAAMLEVIRSKRGASGGYRPESAYQPYKAWDFGQKKEDSPWLAFLIRRLEARFDKRQV
ncbi:MAG: hypothetical protein KKB59_09985, partial [Spirochaetes bacterium]|nr:hypothetical protein [Spirochaetota bacterium]